MTESLIIGNRYKLLRALDSGGMATVYMGHDLQTGATVAIKALRPDVIHAAPEIVDRFIREGEALRMLDHPNIVKVLDTLEDAGTHYVVMEYVKGGSLAGLLEREGRLPLPRVLNIALDISDALIRAHKLKIIHRDIKPANVLIADDGTPRLSDFGVAQFGDGTRFTQPGALIGTMAYLSPEVCMGEDLDARTDIWSFGVMLYEMLAGFRPFGEGENSSTMPVVLVAIMQQAVTPLHALRDDLPPGLSDLVDLMLQKDRDQRIDSFRLVGAALEAIIAGKHPFEARETEAEVSSSAESLDFSQPAEPPVRVAAMPPEPGENHPAAAQRALLPAARMRQETPALPRRERRSLLGAGALIVIVAVFAVVLWYGGQSQAAVAVAPVQQGQYLVLIAQLELINGAQEDPSRFFVSDLAQIFEQELPYSLIRVRSYPRVVTSTEQAAQAAALNQAPLIIWGNYDGVTAVLNFQLGSVDAMSFVVLTRAAMEEVVNLRLTMTDVRRQSLFEPVISAVNTIATSALDLYTVASNLSSLELLSGDPPSTIQIEGSSVAAHWYRYVADFVDRSEASLASINAAIALQRTNPMLFIGRAFVLLRLGDTEQAIVDVRTARALSNDVGVVGSFLIAQAMLVIENDPVRAYTWYDEAYTLMPQITATRGLRGAAAYLSGRYDEALEDLLLLRNEAGWASSAYPFLAGLALREGDLAEAQRLLIEARTISPDVYYGERIVSASFNVNRATSPALAAMGAFSSLALLQWQDVIDNAQLAINNPQTHFAVNDVYVLQGLAQCNLGDFAAAEASYSQLIALEPAYLMAHVLRLEVRLRQGNLVGAQEDVAALLQSDQASRFTPLVEPFMNGDLRCENFFDNDLSQYIEEIP